MARRRWSELSTRSRALILIAAVVDGLLRIAALLDLRRRPAEQIRGSKGAWATAIVLVNSLGAVPIAYFACGRRAPGSDALATTSTPVPQAQGAAVSSTPQDAGDADRAPIPHS
ncbi:hypothetical protein [Nocardia seriolae]|uniref:hypothetical protein n=1 Tax=Nocardia seriolae TaxID=37332 RepID=UPI000909C6E5|nr:hypothetical protein [Nocardia seriolae]BAW06671.1 conserved hypothetical protein [Nocardia seriolae]